MRIMISSATFDLGRCPVFLPKPGNRKSRLQWNHVTIAALSDTNKSYNDDDAMRYTQQRNTSNVTFQAPLRGPRIANVELRTCFTNDDRDCILADDRIQDTGHVFNGHEQCLYKWRRYADLE